MSITKTKLKLPRLWGDEIRADHQNQAIRKVIQVLLDKIFYVVLTVGSIATVLSALRAFSQGWHLNVILDIATFGLFILIILFRRFIPVAALATIVLVAAGVLFISNFYTVGLGSMGLAALIALCVIAGAIFGFRVGVVYLIVSLIGVAVAGVLNHYGVITPLVALDSYLQSPQTWVSQLGGYVLCGIVSLIVVSFIQKRLWSALVEINQKSAALEEREEKYRLLTENMRDVLFNWDIELVFTYVSPSVRSLFGYTVGEILDMSMDQLLTPDSVAVWKKRFSPFASPAGRDTLDVPLLEFEFVRKDGSSFFGELKSSFIRDDDGNLVGIQGNLRDISDRKQAEEEKRSLEDQLLHAEKMHAIGQLAGGVAHDFNNQLAGIMGLADMLQTKYAKDPKVSTFAKGIMSGVERASDLIQKLLAFARKGKYQSVIIDIHVIIREVISIVSRSLDKTIQITEQLNAAPSTIKGDPSQIENCLLNIAINARDAMPKGGELSFATSVESLTGIHPARRVTGAPLNQYVCIDISDTGIGMTPEIRRRIFEPFFTTKDSDKGTGMGLAAVYGTIQNHGGAIHVLSEAENGSTFRIYLPTCAEVAAVLESQTSEAAVAGSGRILVVEDEPTVLDITAMVLENLGYTVMVCSSGKEALTIYEENWRSLDAVVLDLILPEVSGCDVFKFIREINADARILLCSGYSADDEVQELLDNDITDFVQKPFTIRELSHVIANLLA